MKKFFKQKNKGFTRILTLQNRKKLVSGFTLMETLVAISIFTMSILGLLSILSQGISNTGYAKQKIIAGYLAQEGIEYIRNMRDTYVLYDTVDANNGWNLFNTKLVSASCNTLNGCYFDDGNTDYTNHSQSIWISKLSINACGSSCPTLLYNATTGKYNYDISGTNSGFSRMISVTPIPPDEMKISSTVSWKQGSGTYNITFSESLFNWVQ